MKTAKDLKIPFTWAERRPILLDRFFYIPACYPYKEDRLPFFPDNRPIIIEYCSGNGQWIGDRAKQNPQFNWIGVEKKFDRARKIWLMMHRESIPNLCVVCGEALTFTRYYAPQAIEAYVNFPDPWPKRRHAQNRLVSAPFISQLSQIIQPGGQVICVTDDLDYSTHMTLEFAQCPDFCLLSNLTEWPDYGRSFFKDLWIEKGRIIHFLSYEKTQ